MIVGLASICYIAAVYLVGRVAGRRGRRPWPWMLLAACTFGLPALIALLALHDLKDRAVLSGTDRASEPPRSSNSATAQGPAGATPSKRRNWRKEIASTVLAAVVILVGVIVYAVASGQPLTPAPSDSQQLANLVTSEVQKQLHENVEYGADPASTRITADCNQVSRETRRTRYVCYAYVTPPSAALVTEQWAGEAVGSELRVREMPSGGPGPDSESPPTDESEGSP